jgi:signal transduction histidine kinase
MDESLWDRIHRIMARLSESVDGAPPRPAGEERVLTERIRRELKRYDEHRDKLSPPDRERLLEFVVQDVVEMSLAYSPTAAAAAARVGTADASPLRLLLDAGAVLVGSLEYEAALDRLARLCVEWLADACAVHLLEPTREVRRAAAVRRAPDGGILLAELGAVPPSFEDPHHPVAAVLRSGETLHVPEVTPEYILGAVTDEGTRADIEALDPRSLLIVPLCARGTVLGALTFARLGDAPPFAEGEVALAEELARRAAVAVEGARLRDEAERARRAKSEFVGSISHEFRTPLMTVMAFAHLLQEGIPAPIPDEAREHVARILAAAGHLDRLVEESLGFQRADAGWETVNPEPVDLAALARESAALVEPLARQKQLDLRVEVPAGGAPAVTDGNKVRQVLFSLLGNAVKFTDRGGIRLVLRAEGERAVLEVIDTGIGIAPENLERVFEPFWQAEPGVAERGPGIGLGLSLLRRLTWMLGGDVRVQSELGRGSVFRVTIPAG